jgi:hypothetical protein
MPGLNPLLVDVFQHLGADRNLPPFGALQLGPSSRGYISTEWDLMTRFKDFWPLYLCAHSHRGTRIGHYAATTIALSTIAASIVLQMIWLTALGIVLGYAIALASHRLVDGSKSLVTVNPVWGAVADFRMCWLALTGGLAAELAEHVGRGHDHAIGPMIKNHR